MAGNTASSHYPIRACPGGSWEDRRSARAERSWVWSQAPRRMSRGSAQQAAGWLGPAAAAPGRGPGTQTQAAGCQRRVPNRRSERGGTQPDTAERGCGALKDPRGPGPRVVPPLPGMAVQACWVPHLRWGFDLQAQLQTRVGTDPPHPAGGQLLVQTPAQPGDSCWCSKCSRPALLDANAYTSGLFQSHAQHTIVDFDLQDFRVTVEDLIAGKWSLPAAP